MKLKELLKDVEYNGNVRDIDIASITHDSRKVREKSLFIAVEGRNVDGYKYIKEAVKNGASAILANNRKIAVKDDITTINVPNTRAAMSKIASSFYGHPSKSLNLIGVTGTNGKTSVCYLINRILNNNNIISNSIGTLGYVNSSNIISTGFTTPESIDLHQILKTSVNAGVENIVLEVSSHSIDMHRVDDLDLDIAIFTNLTPEHLDFHKTMDNYCESKKTIFKRLNADKISILNRDDEYFNKIRSGLNSKIITYGLNKNSDIYPSSYDFLDTGTNAKISVLGNSIEISTNLIGKYNLYNILASIAAANCLNIDLNQISKTLNEKICIPGRLEVVSNNNKKIVVVDYAHTVDAFYNVLETISKLKYENIITLFGCGGDRDKSKRALMAEIAEKYSSQVIVTADNPRTENLNDIMSDISSGFKKNNYKIINSREDALIYSLKIMEPNSILLILGKGAENYQEINGVRLPHYDREIILRIINAS